MRIDVFTIFPGMVEHFVGQSLLGRARVTGELDLRVHDLRSCAIDPHRSVDDAPFGGGAGMVLMPEPVFAAVEVVDPPRPLLYLGPAGRRFDQPVARELAGLDGFSLLCGRYEGVDARIRDHLCDGELSIGDVVLAGGEVAAMVVVEAVGRPGPRGVGEVASGDDEAFGGGPPGYSHHTRPGALPGGPKRGAGPRVPAGGDTPPPRPGGGPPLGGNPARAPPPPPRLDDPVAGGRGQHRDALPAVAGRFEDRQSLPGPAVRAVARHGHHQ